jgi:arginine-tRNA-protein transferase
VESRLRFYAPQTRCEYLPDRLARLEYEFVDSITAGEYAGRLQEGWRRFGHVLFRPACRSCRMCQSLRIPVAAFRPRRTQRRVWNTNAHAVEITIGTPTATAEKLALYERFHQFQHEAKGWPLPEGDGLDAFVTNPFPTEEWCYHVDGRLVAVGYVDVLPEGLSAIYFFYDPKARHRSLGTFNVLSIVDAARARGLMWVYLGYYVQGCRSVEYKARFIPNEVLGPDGAWVPFVS